MGMNIMNQNAGVRYGVARNTSTSAKTLALLAKDQDAGVRQAAQR